MKGYLPSKIVFHQKLSSNKGHLPSHQRLFSIKGCLPSKVVFHQRMSSIKCCLPSKGVFHQRLSSIKCHLSSKVFFHQMLSSIEGRLLSKVAFHQRLSSIKSRLQFCCIKWALKWSRMVLYHLLLSKTLYRLTITDRQADRNSHFWGHDLMLCRKRIDCIDFSPRNRKKLL